MSGSIYGLVDPRTDEVRYIGRTVRRPVDRLYSHLNDVSDTYKCRWIATLRAAGLGPTLRTLETGIPTEQINERECWWIAYAREQGWQLTNGTQGGDGLVAPTAHTLARLSAARRARPPASAETRAKLAAVGKQRVWTPETRAAISAALHAQYTDEARKAKSERMKLWWAERRAATSV